MLQLNASVMIGPCGFFGFGVAYGWTNTDSRSYFCTQQVIIGSVLISSLLFSLYFLHSKAFQVFTHVSQKIRTMKIAADLMEVSKYNNTLTVFAEMVTALYTGLKVQY